MTRIIMTAFLSMIFLFYIVPSGIAAEKGMNHDKKIPSDQLKKEHDITLVVAEAVRDEASKIRRTGKLDRKRIGRFIDFFSNFTDKCHHAKEERYYFAAAQVYDGPQIDQQVAELMAEHVHFRGMLEQIGFLIERDSPDTAMIAERLDRYAEILGEHVRKENRVLFAAADIVVPVEEKRAMLESFEHLEKVELGEGFHEKYHELAKELSRH